MEQLHLIMPMGGRGYRFFRDGFVMPKPLIELSGKPFFYWAIQSVLKFTPVKDLTCVVLQEHVDRFRIDRAIRDLYPEARIVVIPEVLDGPVLTCLEGIREIRDDGPLLFNDCDHMFVSTPFNRFCAEGNYESPDGALLTFEADDPRYSYLRCDDNGNVTMTVEKQVVSRQAICGAYYFRNSRIFREAARRYLHECSYSEFFISGVYNIMADQGRCIRSFPTDLHISFGTPEEYFAAEKNPQLRLVEA